VGQGVKAAPVGGSDDHSAGGRRGAFDSLLGSPTTLVFAREPSVPALLAATRKLFAAICSVAEHRKPFVPQLQEEHP
jgi:hypothetical protein